MFDGMLNMGEPWLEKMGERVLKIRRYLPLDKCAADRSECRILAQAISCHIIVHAVSLTGGSLDVSSSRGIHAMIERWLDYAIRTDTR